MFQMKLLTREVDILLLLLYNVSSFSNELLNGADWVYFGFFAEISMLFEKKYKF